MSKFTNGAHVVEAVQITKRTFDDECPAPRLTGVLYDADSQTVTIDSPFGRMVGRVGDWIVTTKGVCCICVQDVFAGTYELVQC